jgi:hypothetical protein
VHKDHKDHKVFRALKVQLVFKELLVYQALLAHKV